MGKSFDIFISYSRNDYSRVEEIVAHLVDNGFTVWIDKDGIESGDAFKSVIVSAIEESNLFVSIFKFIRMDGEGSKYCNI